MIFMGTYRMPGNKLDEWLKCFANFTANSMPSCIKKWETYSCAAGKGGSKGYNIIYSEKGKADEALIEINKLMLPFSQIEGASWKLEPLVGVSDSLKILGKA
jgi:hypothetical protein